MSLDRYDSPGVPSEREGAPTLLVATENGSRYRIDMARLTVVRLPNLDIPEGTRLRRDEEEIQLLGIYPIMVGHPMTLVLNIRGDGIRTLRQTGDVSSIEWLT